MEIYYFWRRFSSIQFKTMKTIYQYGQYWKHLNQSRHRKGHGVHSPFVFDLITNVVEENNPYYCYDNIESSLQEKKRHSDANNTLSPEYARLLFRLLYFWKPDCSKSFGLSDDVRAKKYVEAALKAIEGCKCEDDEVSDAQCHPQSKQHRVLLWNAASFHSDELESSFECVNKQLKKNHEDGAQTMLIVLHPYLNPTAAKCWTHCVSDKEIALCLDCFGLAFAVDAPFLPFFRSKLSV